MKPVQLGKNAVIALGAGVAVLFAGTGYYFGHFGQELDHTIRAIPAVLNAPESRTSILSFFTGVNAESPIQPVVSYQREALISQNEKAKLRVKLIEPLIAAGRAAGHEYVAVIVTVPDKIGAKYKVTAIDRNGIATEFSFGARGKDFDALSPDSMKP